METTTLQRSGDVYTDIHGLQNLKRGASAGDEDSLRAVARQFESMLVNMMMKSMRDANAVFEEDSPFQSQEGKFFRDMHDQQMSLTLSQQGGLGLTEVLVRQLSKQLPQTVKSDSAISGPDAGLRMGASAAETTSVAGPSVGGTSAGGTLVPKRDGDSGLKPRPQIASSSQAVPVGGASAPNRADDAAKAATTVSQEKGFLPAALQKIDQIVSAVSSFRSPADFVAKLFPLAEHAASELGASPKALLAQAALETGWGKHIIGDARDSSFNLFNIKADTRWDGASKAVKTLEFKGGVAEQVRDSFRSYGSFAESFMDYVRFLQDNPRYSGALQKAGDADAFVSALHEAGYATDPAYSAKIQQIMNSDVFEQALAGVKAGAGGPILNTSGSAR